MLTIRKPQTEAFRRYGRDQFASEMARHLRAIYPIKTEGISDQALTKDIQVGIKKATNYGIRQPFDLQHFLEIRIELGADFDTNPDMKWASEILNSSAITASEKIDALDDHISFVEVG
ncbi:MAG: hypothetical protein ABG776_15485 [Cyanobacteria bacterium J06555_13]